MAATNRPRIASFAAPTLIVLGLVAGLWSIYQWFELVKARTGGEISCSISETLDCAQVWEAPVAKAVHALTGVPVAGWGVVWGLVALAAGWRLRRARSREQAAPGAIAAARLVAITGVLACVGLLAVSAQLGVLCPTCLATYVLVGAYAAVAFFGTKVGELPNLQALDLRWVLGPVVLGWLLALGPGLHTPTGASVVEAEKGEDEAFDPDAQLAALVSKASPMEVGKIVEIIRRVATSTVAPPEPRRRIGSAKASVHLTDFSDVRCGHCRNLVEVLHFAREKMPHRFSEDARYFPLAPGCNPLLSPEGSDPSGVRCFGAKVLLCFEQHPKYEEFRALVFQNQASLDAEMVGRLATKVLGVSEAEVAACGSSSDIDATLAADIELAQRYGLRGTPLVLANGVEIPGNPKLVYALLLSGADPDHAVFRNAIRTEKRQP